MHFSALFAAAGLLGVAAAQANVQCLQTAEAVPMCGQACLTKAASSYGCAFTDFACQCSHSAQINNAALTACVLSECNDNTQTALAVASGAEAVCSCVNSVGGVANGPAQATSTAYIPANTAAIGPVPAAVATSKASMAVASSSAPAVKTSAAQTSAAHVVVSFSEFTGGAVPAGYVAGSLGGIALGILGAVAAL